MDNTMEEIAVLVEAVKELDQYIAREMLAAVKRHAHIHYEAGWDTVI